MTPQALIRNQDGELQGCVLAFFRQNELFVLTVMGQQLLFLEKPIKERRVGKRFESHRHGVPSSGECRRKNEKKNTLEPPRRPVKHDH
jgi:hypothetical protein